jgi:uncharacterized protein YggU (UPF0235/DUF167 family)
LDGAGPGGELRARVSAAPADGEANRALLVLLAAELRVPRTALALEHGARSRTKRVRVEGMSAASLAARWPGLDAEDVR